MKLIQNLKSICFIVFITISTSFLAAAQVPTENALLWKIEGNGLVEPSYLFGTIHMMCKEDFEMPEKVEASVKKSDAIALEIDMDDPELQRKMQQLSVNPGMKNITEDLNDSDIKILDDFFKNNYGQGIAQIGILKPFVLSSMVVMNMANCDIVQYESEFVKLAKKYELEVVGLESVEFQFELFNDLDYQKQVEALVESITDPEETKEMLDKVQEAYLEKDIQKIESLMEEYEEYEGFNEKLLDERNEKWVKSILESAKDESVFYAVGSGHLPGEKGVIALLREAGFTLTPVE